MIKCPICGAENQNLGKKCTECGGEINNSPNYICSEGKWIIREEYMARKLLKDSEYVVILFVVIATLSFLFAFVFFFLTYQLLISIIIVITGILEWFIGIFLRDLFEGLSMTVENSIKKYS